MRNVGLLVILLSIAFWSLFWPQPPPSSEKPFRHCKTRTLFKSDSQETNRPHHFRGKGVRALGIALGFAPDSRSVTNPPRRQAQRTRATTRCWLTCWPDLAPPTLIRLLPSHQPPTSIWAHSKHQHSGLAPNAEEGGGGGCLGQ